MNVELLAQREIYLLQNEALSRADRRQLFLKPIIELGDKNWYGLAIIINVNVYDR